ncbi:MAG: PA domain-containing protein [Gammaproteobacteria bacterium]
MSRNSIGALTARLAVCAALLGSLSLPALGAATITVVNANAPGEGFNDPTPASPVGGNSGATLGAQRLIAFQHAANLWAANIDSPVPIRVSATFEPLSCTESSAVLGAAGTVQIFADFPNTPKPTAWYPSALASKLAGADLTDPGDAHIQARFNSRLGLFPDCLPGAPFYLGLDNAHSDQIDLVTVLLHELAHGLGFQSFTSSSTGERVDNRPAVWDYFLLDSRNDKLWLNMTDEERRASAISGNALVWSGPNVTNAVPQVLAAQAVLRISGQAAGPASGSYDVGEASFGPVLSNPPVSGELMPVVDQANGSGLACTPLDAANALAVKGNIALVDRGECGFALKAKNVQEAGARGMVVADNVPGEVAGMGGTDPTITIPSARITQAAGQALKVALERRSRTASGVTASLGVDSERLAGTDRAKRIRMFTPSELAPGSSVSHYTVEAKPNQLMEPAINPDLIHEVKPPRDLTLPLRRDIGW